jgi:FKBP-type peptidyl-prolyl cis-trans isomerase 2
MKKFLLLSILWWFAVSLAWCWTQGVKVWDKISVVYDVTLPDWTLYKSNEKVTFTVWSGEVIAGLDEWIIWVKPGKKTKIIVSPDKWYITDHSENKVQKVAKLIFDKMGKDIKIWEVTALSNITGVITWIEKDKDGNDIVIFDTNPLYTQQDLTFSVTVDPL